MESVFNTFLGNFAIEGSDGIITGARFVDNDVPESICDAQLEYVKELRSYFEGRRPELTIRFEPSGTPFQLAVWQVVSNIPYGEVSTYGEIAKKVGMGANPRNVGQANGQNKLSILIPCHRVVAKEMELAGYAWGLERKRKLLQLEGAIKQTRLFE